MATTFLFLPAEIRNAIYAEVLRRRYFVPLSPSGIEGYNSPSTPSARDDGTSSAHLMAFRRTRDGCNRSSALLRTCRQIYQEATHFLVAYSVFEFSFCTPFWHGISTIHGSHWPFPKTSFALIQFLCIGVDTQAIEQIKPEEIDKLLFDFAAHHCKLKCLTIDFFLIKQTSSGLLDRWIKAAVKRNRIPASIKALRSLQDVSIRAYGREGVKDEIYGELVQSIERSLGWERDQKIETNRGKDAGDVNGSLVRKWLLLPPTHKPEAPQKGDLSRSWVRVKV